MSSCLFCKLINREIPSRIVYEDELMLVFHDIKPKAPIHLLLIPKKHIENLLFLTPKDKELIGEMMLKVPLIAKENHLSHFKLLSNNGAYSGQEVFHLHFHLMGNRVP